MAWDTGTITSAAPWAAISQKLKDLISSGSGVANWGFVENVPAGTGIGQSGSALYSLDVFRCRGAATLYKRLVQINLANSQITTDGTSFVHTVTSPSTNQFITVCVINTKASAADDPTSVSLNGINAPTFTKIKSQASGGAGTIIKMTLWIAKTGGSTPTGTQLTVSYGANTQTGCMVIMDQFDGTNVSLGADAVDPTGATKIGIQVVGAAGTTETAHSATLAAFLGSQSCAVTWAAQTASTGTYLSGVDPGWSALAADLALSTPTAHARGMYRPDPDDTQGVLTISSITSQTDWACIALEFQRTTAATSITNANDAGKDWHFVIEIPVPDGAVSSNFNACEDYDGNKLFRRFCSIAGTATPILPGYWKENSLGGPSSGTLSYANVAGNNRTNLTHGPLTTTGFSYWIKLTNNGVLIATRAGGVENTTGAMLLDSFVTNAPDLPLIAISDHVAAGNTFSRLPGVITSVTSGWAISTMGWTAAVSDQNSGFTSNLANSQDLWSSNKIHVARLLSVHTAGRSTTNAINWGYVRGLWKTDFLCLKGGSVVNAGTVNLGDTMVISGNTWTVIAGGNGQTIVMGSTGSQALIVVTRAT